MNSRSFVIYLTVILQVLLLSTHLFAAGDAAEHSEQLPSIAKLYDEAKFFYNQLETNSDLTKSRESWLKGARNFRKIYQSNPKSDLAPSCLFMLGRLYGDMYDQFQVAKDLQEAISYFKETARLFPQHRLADDAYFTLAQLTLDKQHDPKKAAEYLVEIVTNYPAGDMHSVAEDLLKILSKDHNIPLPKVMISSAGENKLGHVLPVKYWSSDEYTRVVIMASGPVKYKDTLLEETENTPRRLYIDFKNSYIEPQYRAPVPIQDGLLRQIRTGQFSPDTVRVVLDIQSIAKYRIFTLPEPFRVVIDVHGKTQQPKTATPPVAVATAGEVKPTAPKIEEKPDIVILRESKKVAFSQVLPAKGNSTGKEEKSSKDKKPEGTAATPALSLAQQLGLGVKKIIIDPGHGGKDPGAMAFGMKEKDIVLDVAKKLAPVLKKELHCEVLLTRDKDVFIPLEERTAIANTHNADLFVSLHINAHPSADVRGLETYYLNLTTNAEAMRVAARENATSTHQMSDLQDILSDIMKNSKINESSRLAQQVHNSMVAKAEEQGYKDIKDLGVKQAPFYVLIGAEMPAILIEIAFISNKKDAKNLQDAKFLNLLTEEIAYGIRAYVSDTTAQLELEDAGFFFKK